MDTKDIIKHDASSIYWQPGKRYAKSFDDELNNQTKTPGKVRDMSQILKQQRIKEIKSALELVERMKSDKSATDISPLDDQMQYQLNRLEGKHKQDKIDYINTLASIPVIDQLISKKEYCIRNNISSYYIAEKEFRDKGMDRICIGKKVFVFKENIDKKTRKRLAEKLSDYVSYLEVSEKYTKYQIYSSKFLIEHKAIKIDDCLLFKKSTL